MSEEITEPIDDVQTDQPSPKKASGKKIVLVAGVLLVVLLLAGVVFFLRKDNDDVVTQKEQNTKDQSAKDLNTKPQESPSTSKAETDFVGMTGACEPVDDHQWYRSDNTLTIDPVNPSNLYVFIEKRGFFASADGGENWSYSSKGIKGFDAPVRHKDRPCYLEFRAAAIDETNPQRILLGALGDFGTIKSTINQAGGMLESVDGGKSWRQILSDSVNAYVHDIVIDPSDPKTIYYVTSSQVGANQSASLLTKGLVYKTTDGGKTWNELPTGILPNTGGQEIFIDRANPKRLMVTSLTFNFDAQGKRKQSGDTLGILRTEDGGNTWSSLKTLPENDASIAASFSAPTNFNNLYIVSFSDTGARAYYSTDGAKSFKKSGLPMDVVAYDPTDPSGKTLIGYAWQSSTGKTLQKSTGAGATWKAYGTLPKEITSIQDPKQRISKIVIDPKNPQNLYMAGASAFVWKSNDGGTTWKTVLSMDTLP